MPFLGHWYALLITVVFWGGLTALVIWAIRRFSRPPQTTDSAMGILNERLARGEIDQQEYEQRKAALLRR